MTLSLRRGAALTASAAALAFVLSGCSLLNIGTGNAARDDEGQVTEESTIDVFSVKVGDCISEDSGEGEVSDIPVVPCDEPYSHQVYFEFSLPDGDFPTDEEIETAAIENCVPAFEDWVGVAYDASALDLSWYSPTAEGWEEANDRIMQCIVFDPASETVEGTLEGVAR